MKKSTLKRIFDKKKKEEEEEEEDAGIIREKKVIKSYTIRTRGGKNGLQDKVNQDSFLANYNLNGTLDTHLFGVYDGHGNSFMFYCLI